jgi:hypothetical protein
MSAMCTVASGSVVQVFTAIDGLTAAVSTHEVRPRSGGLCVTCGGRCPAKTDGSQLWHEPRLGNRHVPVEQGLHHGAVYQRVVLRHALVAVLGGQCEGASQTGASSRAMRRRQVNTFLETRYAGASGCLENNPG